jgi:aldose 1-epimerase
MLQLAAGDYRLVLQPEVGGSVAGFYWRDKPVFRPACGPSVLDAACFPLAPFSNRIAHGRFRFGGRGVALAPNFPDSDHPHPLHGFGWLGAWEVIEQDAATAVLEYRHPAGEWPWAFRAVQRFVLTPAGLEMSLELRNQSAEPMPGGIGFHPYFPRDDDTRYFGLHRGEWRNSPDCLPQALICEREPIDWWNGGPVGSRLVDTVYTGREGPLVISWPSRSMTLIMEPSEALPFTVVYTPEAGDYFCVEPVSNSTDAFNRNGEGHAFHDLAPGESLAACLRLTCRATPSPGP